MPQVRVRIPDQPLPGPEGANFFHFTHMQGEVEMLVGYLDLRELHETVGSAEDAEEESDEVDIEVSAEITHRLVLSVTGFQHLRDRVVDMWGKIEAQVGEREEEEEEEEEGGG